MWAIILVTEAIMSMLHVGGMKYLWSTSIVIASIYISRCESCQIDCSEDDEMVCGLNIKERAYKMFSSKCAMNGYNTCNQADFSEVPLKFCIKALPKSRRYYEESCPVFCPEYYRPVCGAAKYKSYQYHSFINGCYMDMVNCRGTDEFTGYVEVPLSHCSNHLMKNIFQEKIIISGAGHDYGDYN